MISSQALIVIDMQLCGFDGEITAPVDKGDELLNGVSTLINAAHDAKIPVVFVQHCGQSGQPYAEDSHGWEIHPALPRDDSDLVVYKRHSNAFEDTQLQHTLSDHGIESILVCGIQSEHCVSNTSNAALDLGIEVYIAEDAHGTVSTKEASAGAIIERQNALLERLGARVQSSAAIIQRLAS
jgi:nicotinamidase-related amidase